MRIKTSPNPVLWKGTGRLEKDYFVEQMGFKVWSGERLSKT